jgi:DNA-binding protein YbaB
MFGKMGDMLGKLQEIKQRIKEIKDRLETTVIDVTGASGDIKLSMNGNRKIQKLHISSALQSASKEELEEQLMTTFNKAIEEADKLTETEMKKVAGGLLPPGIL